MLQRGGTEKKRDLEDIEDLLRIVNVDERYLHARLLEVNADERVLKALRKFNLIR